MPRGILRLERIEFSAVLGILPEEKLSPRLVDLDIECSGEWAAGDPPLIDYRKIVDAIAERSGREYGLLEELVSDLLAVLVLLRPDLAWKLTASKPFPSLKLRTDRAVFSGSSV